MNTGRRLLSTLLILVFEVIHFRHYQQKWNGKKRYRTIKITGLRSAIVDDIGQRKNVVFFWKLGKYYIPFMLFLITVITSCEEVNPQMEVTIRNETLQTHWNTYVQEREARGIPPYEGRLTLEVGEIEDGKMARTYFLSSGIKVVFNKKTYLNSSDRWQEIIFFHEMGHAIHIYMENEEGIRLMASPYPLSYFNLYRIYRNEWLDEFFRLQ